MAKELKMTREEWEQVSPQKVLICPANTMVWANASYSQLKQLVITLGRSQLVALGQAVHGRLYRIVRGEEC